jgi:polyphosphate kinase
LEHARIFHFKNGGDDEVFCSSADWMPRNFRRRVEVMFPVLDPALKRRLIDEILHLMRSDTAKGWILGSDGSYSRATSDGPPVRSQYRFMELARERGRETVLLNPKPFTPVTAADTAIEKLRTLRNKRRQQRKRRK